MYLSHDDADDYDADDAQGEYNDCGDDEGYDDDNYDIVITEVGVTESGLGLRSMSPSPLAACPAALILLWPAHPRKKNRELDDILRSNDISVIVHKSIAISRNLIDFIKKTLISSKS